MTTSQQKRVRDLFEAALDLEPANRLAWAGVQAADDPSVREELISLLRHDLRAGNFLTAPIVERIPGLLEEDEALASGAAVGPYSIIRELGRGGMGRVYLATDGRLGRTVAIKALAPHLTRDPRHRERLRREARAAATLTHPAICAVYALEEMDGNLFIATEYVDGSTLREEMASGRPSVSEILNTAGEIAAGLAAAHEHGVTHRDLKPENIMRTRDGRVKILDFGLAHVDAPTPSPAFVTEPGLLVGTPAYMAPEQLTGQPIDVRADVFAYGVLLYEYIGGTHPFAAPTPLATVARVLESVAKPLANECPHVPKAILDVVDRCLRKVPEERFRSAAEIVQALSRTDPSSISPAVITWWRAHQVIITGLYVLAATVAWNIKEWVPAATTVSIFVALGVGAAIGGVLRGHLVFTERMNRLNLGAERRRAMRPLLVVDVLMAAALVADATMLTLWPLTAVLTMAIGVGIGLAATVLEPATTRAAFGDE